MAIIKHIKHRRTITIFCSNEPSGNMQRQAIDELKKFYTSSFIQKIINKNLLFNFIVVPDEYLDLYFKEEFIKSRNFKIDKILK